MHPHPHCTVFRCPKTHSNHKEKPKIEPDSIDYIRVTSGEASTLGDIRLSAACIISVAIHVDKEGPV